MSIRLAVVVSQGQSPHPAKRQLEEEIVGQLLGVAGVDLVVIPHLYDLAADTTGLLALQGISSHMVVLSWLFPRAAHWILDRQGVHGEPGKSLLKTGEGDESESDEDDENEAESEQGTLEKHRVADSRPRLQRRIYCLDLRGQGEAKSYLDEIRRIHQELNTKVVDLGGWIGGTPSAEQLDRYRAPRNDTALGTNGNGALENPPQASSGPNLAAGAISSPAIDALAGISRLPAAGSLFAAGTQTDGDTTPVVRISDTPDRRWYPVIDYSRCTNCMECIDFCLFGVYGVDRQETILVEQADNCRKGCPACSRVCPENAIIFPQHKSPEIAGAAGVSSSLKIDLSQLFGGGTAVEVAAQERDEQLLLSGREAVGLSVGIPKRQAGKQAGPKDTLDKLVDQLDELDL